MKTVKTGDKSKAICHECECVVETTFMIRDVALSDNSAIVENLLIAVCNNCDAVVALPQQSSKQVNHAITNEKAMARKDRADRKFKGVTLAHENISRLPPELEDLEVGEMALVDGKAFMRVEVEIDNNEKELN
jgi:dynactin complex subunit